MRKLLLINVFILLAGYGMAQTEFHIIPGFTKEASATFCHKTEIPFTNTTIVLPAGLTRNKTVLKLVYDWGDGDSLVFYAKSGERTVTGHTYHIQSLRETFYVKLKASILDSITHLPTGSEEVYVDSLVITRPIADFTDNGHEFPCPDNTMGVKGRTITFINQSQGATELLAWDLGDTFSGNGIEIPLNSDTVVHTYMYAGLYSVLLIVQDENRCTDSMWKKDHVNIMGARGNVSIYEEYPSNCKPSIVSFNPSVENDREYQPDSIAVFVGTGEIYRRHGDYYNLTRPIRHVYQNSGTYLPVSFLYKTVEFSGRKETCIIQIQAKDTIYVVDLDPEFETQPLYSTNTPITFKNTSSWIPSHLGDTSVKTTWDMGKGESVQTSYHGTTSYDNAGVYEVKLRMQVLRCIKEKTVEIEVANSSTVVHVTVIANDSVMGTVTGSGVYFKDSTAIICAIPHYGYRFAGWNDGNTNNPRTITATQDTIFTAVFESTIGITGIATSPIAIYPNPATDNIHIILPETVSTAVFTLYDMQGRVLIQQNIGNQETVSVSNLAAGIYIYSIGTEKENYQGKTVIK